MSSPTGSEAREPLSDRLLSIDALRGFDMFWIMGAEDIAKEFAKWSDMPGRNLVDEQLEHVPWAGFHFYDLIFPLFLFLVGAVLPFSLGKLRERGAPARTLYWRIIRRTILLLLLGVFYNNYGSRVRAKRLSRVAARRRAPANRPVLFLRRPGRDEHAPAAARC